MIKFEKTEKRKYTIFNENGDEKAEVVKLDLQFSPITNKFERLSNFIEECSLKLGPEFDTWYIGFLDSYKGSGYDYAVVKEKGKFKRVNKILCQKVMRFLP